MNTVVFLGPTLPRGVAMEILPATYLPPASLGDVYSAARRKPWAIAIIDGYFDRVPAVWHKEILWAMARGVHVYGASSMGALRAAELEAFGMVGCGRVFESYRDGVIEDDDEVALMHAPSEFGFVAGSEAMVNMRATFAAARDARVINEATHDLLVSASKELFYAERDYQRALMVAEERGADPSDCRAFREWLPSGRRDVKRADAIELLERIAAEAPNGAPKRVGYSFHATAAWMELRNTVESRPLDSALGVEMSLDDDALDELRLEGEAYVRERDRALTRLFAVEMGYQHGSAPAPLATHLVAESVRNSLGLPSREAVNAWFERQHLTPDGVERLMEDEAHARGVASRYRALVPSYLRDHLRLSGRFGELVKRAGAKQEVLWQRGLQEPSLARAGISEGDLWEWFFVTLLGRAVPGDLAAQASALDFPNVDLMRRAALREYLYRELAPESGGMDGIVQRAVVDVAG
jgi:hypothetical protein